MVDEGYKKCVNNRGRRSSCHCTFDAHKRTRKKVRGRRSYDNAVMSQADDGLSAANIFGSFKDRSAKSIAVFQRDVFSIIRPWVSGRMLSIDEQATTSDIALALDKCGIDALVIEDLPMYGVYGVAARTMNAHYEGSSPLIFTGFSIRCGRADRSDPKKISRNVEYSRLKKALIDEPDSRYLSPSVRSASWVFKQGRGPAILCGDDPYDDVNSIYTRECRQYSRRATSQVFGLLLVRRSRSPVAEWVGYSEQNVACGMRCPPDGLT